MGWGAMGKAEGALPSAGIRMVFESLNRDRDRDRPRFLVPA